MRAEEMTYFALQERIERECKEGSKITTLKPVTNGDLPIVPEGATGEVIMVMRDPSGQIFDVLAAFKEWEYGAVRVHVDNFRMEES